MTLMIMRSLKSKRVRRSIEHNRVNPKPFARWLSFASAFVWHSIHRNSKLFGILSGPPSKHELSHSFDGFLSECDTQFIIRHPTLSGAGLSVCLVQREPRTPAIMCMCAGSGDLLPSPLHLEERGLGVAGRHLIPHQATPVLYSSKSASFANLPSRRQTSQPDRDSRQTDRQTTGTKMADAKQQDDSIPNPNDVVHAAELHDIGEEGSDMTRDIFMALFSNKERAAARSMPDVSEVLYEDIGKASDMAQPGGFRRGHVLASRGGADDDGNGSGDGSPSYAHASFLDSFASMRAGRNAVKSSYDDFIIANLGYGMSREDFYDEDDDGEANTPLVHHRVTKTIQSKAGQQAYQTFSSDDERESRGASVRKTVFTILKSFIGSGILFLPKAFQHGGMLFSIVGLFISASLSTFCMLRLTDCSNAVMRATGGGSGGVSYGLLGERSFGKWGRLAVNVSLVLSQLGFCCSYLIFVEKNIGDIIAQVFHTNDSVASFSWTLILLQIPLYTPLTWVRRIEYFAITNLIADVLILFGLIYIIGYSVEKLEAAPPRSSTWENFNSKSWALFLGTAVYCFEGIGLILPIYDAMDAKIKHKFPKIIALTILFLVVLFSFFAGIVYAAFGEDTQSVVTLNLPNASVSGATMTVQLTYSLALVLTYPLMLYPVVKILENYLFAQRRVKGYWRWQKNGFRFVLVCLTAAIAFFGKNQLDNFVALIGGFCSVPLAFIYPCLFHSQLVNNGHWLNATVIVIGAFTMVFASYQALATWS